MTSETLRAQVAEDRARSEDILRKRDAERRRRDTERVVGGDVDTDGRLVEVETFTVTGWKTNEETEAGLQRKCVNPAAASAAVRSMLDVGYYQVVIESSKRPAPSL